ncbi:hypothetical protein C5167_013973 [Papaver somniferum]|uniref:Uncharacterized protein n=1 Tax=Papaver somniferum TaxID=3469 RepID=A0A4Y7J4Y7_PAPSO|nr:hypothetical protein C5167_013973 [Papaver somniferum]
MSYVLLPAASKGWSDQKLDQTGGALGKYDNLKRNREDGYEFCLAGIGNSAVSLQIVLGRISELIKTCWSEDLDLMKTAEVLKMTNLSCCWRKQSILEYL